VAESNSSAFGFLNLLLDYHTKTYTMPVYISNLLTAVSHQFSAPKGPRDVYQISSSGPLLLSAHLERLGKCVHRFLTSGQTVEIIRRSLQKLQDDWEHFRSLDSKVTFDNNEGSRKRRKLDTAADRTENPEDLAISLSLSSRFASVVLSSLPVQSTSDPIRHDVRKLIDDAQTAFIQVSLNKMLEVVQNEHSSDTRATQIVTAAILRLWDVLNRASKSPSLTCDSKLLTRFTNIIRDDATLPELHLELVCAFSFTC
jgi:hypothetical protein